MFFIFTLNSRETERERELRVTARAKWIRFVYQRTLWPDKLQEGWTRCPTVVLLCLMHVQTLTLCLHQIQMHACKVCEDIDTCWRTQQRERELVIEQEHA